MQADIVAGLTLFVVSIVVLYFTRSKTTRTGRLLLVVGIVGSAMFTAWRASRRDSAAEKVFMPDAHVWEDVPVPVWFDRETLGQYAEPLTQAVVTWNKRVGCPTSELFELVSSKDNAKIVFRSYDGTKCSKEGFDEDDEFGAGMRFCRMGRPEFGGLVWADVQIKQLDEITLAHRIFLHELGHTVGLDHDRIGAMSPNAVSRRDGDYPDYLLPSDKDVEHLRIRYCRDRR